MVSVSRPGNTELKITEPETSVYRHAVISAARSRAQPSPAQPTESFFPFGAIRTRHGHGMERSRVAEMLGEMCPRVLMLLLL